MMGPEDIRHIEKVSKAVEDPFAGLAERISELDAMQLGRAIEHIQYTSTWPYERERIGYILPSVLSNTQHLVILKNGLTLLIEPVQPVDSREYQQLFGPNTAPLEAHDVTADMSINKGFLDPNNSLQCKVVHRSDRGHDREPLAAAYKQSLDVAKKLKEKRDNAKELSGKDLLSALNDFLGYPNPPEEE